MFTGQFVFQLNWSQNMSRAFSYKWHNLIYLSFTIHCTGGDNKDKNHTHNQFKNGRREKDDSKTEDYKPRHNKNSNAPVPLCSSSIFRVATWHME